MRSGFAFVTLATLVAVTLAGCSATRPAVVVAGDLATVRASDLATATRLARDADDLARRLTERYPGFSSAPFEIDVYMRDPEGFAGVHGTTDLAARRIVIFAGEIDGLSAEAMAAAHRSSLAHELVHLGMQDPWYRLPWAAIEGLADALALELVPDDVFTRGARCLAVLNALGRFGLDVEPAPGGRPLPPIVIETPRVDSLDALAWVPDAHAPFALTDQTAPRGFGTLLVESLARRVGYAGLYEICREHTRMSDSKIEPEALAETAGLVSPEAWAEAALGALDAGTAERVAEVFAPLVRDHVAQHGTPGGSVLVSISGSPWSTTIDVPQTTAPALTWSASVPADQCWEYTFRDAGGAVLDVVAGRGPATVTSPPATRHGDLQLRDCDDAATDAPGETR